MKKLTVNVFVFDSLEDRDSGDYRKGKKVESISAHSNLTKTVREIAEANNNKLLGYYTPDGQWIENFTAVRKYLKGKKVSLGIMVKKRGPKPKNKD